MKYAVSVWVSEGRKDKMEMLEESVCVYLCVDLCVCVQFVWAYPGVSGMYITNFKNSK